MFIVVLKWDIAGAAAASALSQMVGYDRQLMELAANGFVIYSFAYLFMGTGIFNSSFFTALNNGLASAAISFLRTPVFEPGAVMLLPITAKQYHSPRGEYNRKKPS